MKIIDYRKEQSDNILTWEEEEKQNKLVGLDVESQLNLLTVDDSKFTCENSNDAREKINGHPETDQEILSRITDLKRNEHMMWYNLLEIEQFINGDLQKKKG